jgi:hypothetical protein
VSLDLALGKQLLSQRPEHASKLKVLGASREGSTAKVEVLTHNSVTKRMLIDNIVTRRLCRQQEGNGAAVGGYSFAADIGRGALGNAVKGVFELVLCVFADLGRAVRVFVVEDCVGAERLYEVVVVRRADGNDFEAGELGVLDG